MKKYVFLLLCIALIACVVGGCGSESDITDEEPIVESNEITMEPVEEQTEELETIDLKVLSGKVVVLGDNSYESALLNSIAVIKELNPDAEIVMLIPTLSYLINMDQLSNEYNFGEGTIDDYISVMKSVAEREGASVVNMQEAWTLTKENWSDYLVDGSHLKKTARREYANFLAQKLYELFVE